MHLEQVILPVGQVDCGISFILHIVCIEKMQNFTSKIIFEMSNPVYISSNTHMMLIENLIRSINNVNDSSNIKWQHILDHQGRVQQVFEISGEGFEAAYVNLSINH